MSNILVITPMYDIGERSELVQDSKAIQDLIKYWGKEHKIYVINAYINGLRHINRYFSIKQLKYYFSGYNYKCNDIPVTLIERQNFFIDQINGMKFNYNRYNKLIRENLNKANFSPDKILVHLPSTTQFLLKKLDYKCEKIAVLHSTDVRYLKKKGDKFIKFLNEKFNYVYCRSKSIYDIFKKTDIQNLMPEIIYSGVNVSENINERNFTKKRTYKILYVGKLIRRKKLDLLVKALSKIDIEKWDLDVIGKGPMEKKYIKLVDKLNLNQNVHFLGMCSKQQVLKYMSNSDIFCMPSVKETFGLVYLEAMSQGCITIGTVNEGIDGIIINNKNGYLVEKDDENKLCELLKKIINSKDEEKNEISKNAIKTAKDFNELDMSKRYLKILFRENEK